MKKLTKIFNSFLFAFLFFVSGFCILASNQNQVTKNTSDALTELPVYFTSSKYKTDEEDNLQEIGSQISDNETVLLEEGQFLRLTLGNPDFNSEYAVFTSPITVSVDNVTQSYISADYIVDNDVVTAIESNYIDLRLDVFGEDCDLEGRYEIRFSYIEYSGTEFSVSTNKSFTYTFFLFKNSTYRASGQPSVTISNVETNIAGTSAAYGRTHQFYYNNKLTSSRRLNLPTLSFDYSRFELEISKTIYNITYYTSVSYDWTTNNIIQTGDNSIVLLNLNNESHQTVVTFNDIGNYQITYKYIHVVDGVKYSLDNLTLSTKFDKMNLFGLQIFHSDINSNETNNKKEFKLFDSTNSLIAGKQTDITFTQFSEETNIVASGENWTINNINMPAEVSFTNFDNIPSTNQAPVEFSFNASIIKDKSCYYKFLSKTEGGVAIWEKTLNYSGTAFPDPGIYLVKTTYASSNAFVSGQEYTQWFYFEIKNNIPTFTISEKDDETKILSSYDWTNKEVNIVLNDKENPFNSEIVLTVSSKNFNEVNFANEVVVGNEPVSFSENKNYKVTVNFGKGLRKQRSTYFSIDNTPIVGITARASEAYGGNYIKKSAIDFFSNQNLSVEWNEKSDNTNITTAYYKYIPMVKTQSSWTTNVLESYYTQGKFVPVDYSMEYSPSNQLTRINYSNTISQSLVAPQNILTENGMYIFYIEDLAGNYVYEAFVIDKTNPNILQKLTDSNAYITDYSSLNIIAENTTIQWGKYKVIKFSGINSKNYNTETWTANETITPLDPWLEQILKTKSNYSKMMTNEDCDFKTITINSQENLYLSSRIDTSNIRIQINANYYDLTNATTRGGIVIDNYSYQINVMNNEVLYEDTYTFFVKDESQILDQYSSLHSVQVSTDISKTAIKFENNQKFDNLVKHSYEIVDNLNSSKYMYYYPIDWDKLQLQYLIAPTLNSIELDYITLNFYSYITDYLIYTPKSGVNTYLEIEANNYYTLNELVKCIEDFTKSDVATGNIITVIERDEYYTITDLIEKGILKYSDFTVGKSIVLSKTPQEITVYDYQTNTNLGTLNSDGYYVYDINTLFNSSDNKYYTKEGKYTFVRSYRELGNTSELVGSRYDFMTRKITFFVDRQKIVSSPVSLNLTVDPDLPEDYALISRIGGSTYIEVLSGTENNKIFSQIYRANNENDSNSISYLLETNMLPLKVYIPVYKFGETINSYFKTQSSFIFFENNIDSYIDSNQLLISIENTTTGEIITNEYAYQISDNRPVDENDYLQIGNKYIIWTGIKNGMIELPTFSSTGIWKVTISQNNSKLKGNKSALTFNINVKIQAPDFTILDQRGNELEYDNVYYWTNNNTIRVQWSDSTNEFMAKVDLEDINCFYNSTPLTYSAIVTSTNGLNHYFDLDIKDLPNNAQILINMHYQGDETQYTSGSWQVTKTVVIDRIAPVMTIEKMIDSINEKSLINTVSLRIGHNEPIGYNKTKNEGMFKNFAFSVDKSQFNTLIYSNTDANQIYYRLVSNKYTDSTVGELDPSDINSLTQIVYGGQFSGLNRLSDIESWTANKYYEIAEIDKAGNLTIYTIYFTDITSERTMNVMEYTDGIDTYSITAQDLQDANYALTIPAKNNFIFDSFNGFGYPWSIITLGNQKYIFTPTLNQTTGEMYKYDIQSSTIVRINQEIQLERMSENYLISISNLPCTFLSLSIAVTDKELDIIHPTLENAFFTVMPVQATSSVKVDWHHLEVWEYVNNTLSKYALFENGTETPIDYLNSESYNIMGITSNDTATLFTIKTPVKGAQYRYKLIDNFGTTYTFQHLYGEEFVQQVRNYDGLSEPLTFEYDGNETYLSYNQFAYSYYHGITSITIQVIEFDNQTGAYKVNSTFAGRGITTNLYFSLENKNSYTTIKLNPVSNTEAINGYKGGVRYFIITAKTEINASENLYDVEKSYFIIYNLTPQINLKGKNRQDLNGLFNSGDNMTSEPVSVEFALNSSELFPTLIELESEDGARKTLSSGDIVSDTGKYKIIVSWTGALQIFKPTTYTFKISSAAWQYYVVEILNSDGVYSELNTTENTYTCLDGKTIYNTHYIVNTNNFKIRTNQTQDIQTPVLIKTDIKNGIETKIYEITNYNSTQSFINFFKTTIAITIVPNTNKLLTNFFYLDIDGTPNSDALKFSECKYVVGKEFENLNSVIVSWNPTYKIDENKIIAEIRYGENNQLINYSNISIEKNLYSIKLTRSGVYSFTFKDKAGNVHKFNYNAQILNSTSTFEFTYLNNVVFTVNDESPIQYAIYNNQVDIKIPAYTLGYYDDNAKPAISVLRNGKEYTDFITSSIERMWSFVETGLYEITWKAKSDTKEIRQEKYYFQIIRANELVWAFNIENYEKYYIKQIIKDKVDITSTLANSGVGNTKTVNGTTYLTNLFVSLYDELTGSGIWTVTIATDNDLQQEFTYSFRINTAKPPINISLEEGEKTTGEIKITFNAYNLYTEVGECIVKITGKQDIVFNDEYFAQEGYTELYEINLTSPKEYFIQIFTPSDRMLFTYKVTKNQPLNAIAIILIVVASVVVAAGLVVFILLRKKMKIR